jgi:hypothetical protein
MFLLFICLGKILAPSCTASCQPSFFLLPLSGSVVVPPLQPLYDSPYTILRHCPPLLHHPSWVTGRSHRRQLHQGLHSSGRKAWQPELPQQTAGFALRRPCHNQAGLVFRPAGFYTFFPGTATRWSGTVFLPGEEVFARLGPAVPSQPPQTWYPSRQRAPPKRLDL